MESTALFGLTAIAFCTAERLVSAYSVERIGGHEHIGDSQAIDLNRKIVVLIFRFLATLFAGMVINHYLNTYENWDSCIIVMAITWLMMNFLIGLCIMLLKRKPEQIESEDGSNVFCPDCGWPLDTEYDFCKVCGFKSKQ